MTTDPRPYDQRPLTDIASAIQEHLQRFERDPRCPIFPSLYRAHADRRGARVGVLYDLRSRYRNLTRPAAVRYLAWLDAGNVGTHHDIPQEFQQ